IALLRMHGYTNEESYRDKAEQTMEVFAGVAAQYGIFGATYGIAGVHFSQPHTQVVVIGEGDDADRLLQAANAVFALNKTSLNLTPNKRAPQIFPTPPPKKRSPRIFHPRWQKRSMVLQGSPAVRRWRWSVQVSRASRQFLIP